MKKIKRIFNIFLFPHKIFVMILFPISMIFMFFSMLYFGMEHIVTYVTYALAFYSLMMFCFALPKMIDFIKKFKNENKYILRYRTDVNLRINISLYLSLFMNTAYSVFQLCLGIYHKSFWFYSMAIYYVLLTLVRLYLVSHTKKNKPRERLVLEYKRYNFCGWIMLLMNLAVTAIIFFIIHFDRTFYHNKITTIALAAYTFIAFGLAIYNVIKFKKYNSPVYSAAKSLNLVAACVSMMTLSTTMLTTFGGEDIFEFKKILLTLLGTVVSVFIVATSIRIIIISMKKLKNIESTVAKR